ncbi:MAG: hypothetical protein GDYSWBUE_001016, partial [Candidatus Fervidibacterota bacterium]
PLEGGRDELDQDAGYKLQEQQDADCQDEFIGQKMP